MNETDRRFMAALQTRIDQLTAENAELRAWLRDNAEHAYDCISFMAEITMDSEIPMPCTCGLTDLISAAALKGQQ